MESWYTKSIASKFSACPSLGEGLVQQTLILLLSTFVFVLELVRRRKLKEEYAWLWVLIGLGAIGLVVFYPALEWLTQLIGAVTVTTTLFIFSLLFLLLINIHMSLVISRLSHQVKRLTQEMALLTVVEPKEPKETQASPRGEIPRQKGRDR